MARPGIELAVRMAADQVVEDVERDADVVGRGAEVRVELGDVAALGDDQLPLLRGLGLGGDPRSAGAPRRPRRGPAAAFSNSRRVNSTHTHLFQRGARAPRNLDGEGSGSILVRRAVLSRVLRCRADAENSRHHEIDRGRRRHRRRHQRHEHRLPPHAARRAQRRAARAPPARRPAPPASRARWCGCTTPTSTESRMAFESLKISATSATSSGGDCGFEARRLRAAGGPRSYAAALARNVARQQRLGINTRDDHAGRGRARSCPAARSTTWAPPRARPTRGSPIPHATAFAFAEAAAQRAGRPSRPASRSLRVLTEGGRVTGVETERGPHRHARGRDRAPARGPGRC